jgi:uncharacterized protein YyaL (SSP411 family)
MSDDMSLPVQQNRLAREQSAYLRSAAHQTIKWYPWTNEAFREAEEQDKPILLDIGAVWCHWCHVMDGQSYENIHIAKKINDNFIAIKVDRDERPDIDSRYQVAVSEITGQGGWPLTVFLLPDGRVFYGGTYFPPHDRHGKPGLSRVLDVLVEKYHSQRLSIQQNATLLHASISEHLCPAKPEEVLRYDLVKISLESILNSYDEHCGGFGTAPKFPHPSVVELLLACYDITGDQWMIEAVKKTLKKMAEGGIYDQLGGGFHRYSTDEHWIVPHFEKMLYDNAPLAMNYIHAFQATEDTFFKDVALDILHFTNEVLTDKTKAGFYASQDADVQFGDDGSFFTWSLDQICQVLSGLELDIMKLHLNVFEVGEMPHDRSQNVLFVDKKADEISKTLGIPIDVVQSTLTSAREKLKRSREQRKSPLVDQTVYANWNGTMISSYIEAFKVFGYREHLDVALRSLQRILNEHHTPTGLISHRAYSIAPETFLDDQVETGLALLEAYQTTGKASFRIKAEELMDSTIMHFFDESNGGFFDIPKLGSTISLLTVRNKPIQDSPTASSNARAITLLLRLHILTDEPRFKEYAHRTLKHFSGITKTFGLFASAYFHALHDFLNPPTHVVLISDDDHKDRRDLHTAALAAYKPGKLVSLVSPTSTDVPPFIKSMLPSAHGSTAFVCSGFVCAPPAHDVETLTHSILESGRPG